MGRRLLHYQQKNKLAMGIQDTNREEESERSDDPQSSDSEQEGKSFPALSSGERSKNHLNLPQHMMAQLTPLINKIDSTVDETIITKIKEKEDITKCTEQIGQGHETSAQRNTSMHQSTRGNGT